MVWTNRTLDPEERGLKRDKNGTPNYESRIRKEGVGIKRRKEEESSDLERLTNHKREIFLEGRVGTE